MRWRLKQKGEWASGGGGGSYRTECGYISHVIQIVVKGRPSWERFDPKKL
jgi:hypothetical protein